MAGTQIFLLVVGAGVSVVISRSLGPAGRGNYAVVVAIAATAVALAHLSIAQVQVYLVSVGRPISTLTSNALVLGAGIGVATAALTLIMVSVLHFPGSDNLHNVPLLLALCAIPPNIVVLYFNALLILQGRTKLLNRGALVAGLTQMALLGALAASRHLTVTTVVSAWLLSAVLPLTVSLPSLQPRRSGLSLTLMFKEVRLGLRYHAGLASLYLLLRVDVLLLARLANSRAVGLYALAVSLVELTNVATDSVATVVLKRQTTAPLGESAAFTARVVGVATVLATVGGLLLAASSSLLIPVVFGAAFRDSAPAVLALVPGVIALAATRSCGAYLLRLNRPWVLTSLNSGAMALNVLTNLALIPRFGIIGAGLASSLAYVLLAAGYLFCFNRATGLGKRAYLPPSPRVLLRRPRA